MPSCKSGKPVVKSHTCLEVKALSKEKEEEKTRKEKREKPQKQLTNLELQGKQIIQFCDISGMKFKLLPSKEPNYYPLKLKDEEIERLKAKAIVLSEKDRLKIIEDAKAEITRQEEESAVRKNELKQFDKKGKMGGKGRLSALEREARDKANYLLKRAWELRKEDEDEVKKANALILSAKCQAIRNAQLVEHELIQREMKEEEKRIEQLMEDERRRQLAEEQKKGQEEQKKREAYIQQLNQQVEEIEAHRLLEAELLMEESRRAKEAMFVVMLEELNELQKKEEEKRKTREAMNAANAQIKRMQALEKEEERLADLRVQQFMEMKAAREEQLLQEKEKERKRKELEFARQRELQERQADLQGMQDEMNAVRRQEEYEREWRRKEKEATKKKLKMEEDCRLAREQQMRDNRRFQAMEIEKEKREFERNLKIQLEIQEKERLLSLKKKHDAEVYREQILKQINAKERERIEERQEKFQEGLALRAEEAKKKSELRQILDKKVEVLRQHNVPEVYISEIQRQLGLN